MRPAVRLVQVIPGVKPEGLITYFNPDHVMRVVNIDDSRCYVISSDGLETIVRGSAERVAYLLFEAGL